MLSLLCDLAPIAAVYVLASLAIAWGERRDQVRTRDRGRA